MKYLKRLHQHYEDFNVSANLAFHRFTMDAINYFYNPKNKINDPKAQQLWNAFHRFLYRNNRPYFTRSCFQRFVEQCERGQVPNITLNNAHAFLIKQGMEIYNVPILTSASSRVFLLLFIMYMTMLHRSISFFYNMVACAYAADEHRNQSLLPQVPLHCHRAAFSNINISFKLCMMELALLFSYYFGVKSNKLVDNVFEDPNNHLRSLSTPLMIGFMHLYPTILVIILHSNQCTRDADELNSPGKFCSLDDEKMERQCYVNHRNAILALCALFIMVTQNCLKTIKRPNSTFFLTRRPSHP